jgi:hypothetical protein
MPNGGPTPACLHCKWFARESQWCSKHNFKLSFILVRVFCTDLEIESASDWVKREVNLSELVPKLLYIWLEVDYTDRDSLKHHTFNLFPFSLIKYYAMWTEDEESEMIGEFAQANRLLVRKLGNKFD